MNTLFRLSGKNPVAITEIPFPREKDLQNLVENNLKTLLGIYFLASEYSTGCHGGRIDTLGLDEFNSPIIIEYKLDGDSSVINQGLFYVNWLLKNKSEFQLLVQERLGYDKSQNINWLGTRLICIAKFFHKYDREAIYQIRSNIDLLEYKYYTESIFGLDTAAKVRLPDYQASASLPPRKALSFYETINQAGSESKILVDKITKAITEISDDLSLSISGRYMIVSNYDSNIFARMRVNSSMTLKLELFCDSQDVMGADKIVKRKTSNGFEVALKHEHDIDQPVEWIRSMYARSSFTF